MFKNRQGEDINVAYANGFGNMHINWGIKNCGFGELYLDYDRERNAMNCSSEYMSKELVKAILCKLIDDSFFPSLEEKKKTVVELSKKEVNNMNLFGVPNNMYLTLPFFSDDDKDDSSVFESRWERKEMIGGIEKNVVINVWLNKEKVTKEMNASQAAYKQETIERLEKDGKSAEDIEEILNAYGFGNVDYLDCLSYGSSKKDLVINETFGDEFVKAEMWIWEISEKEEK